MTGAGPGPTANNRYQYIAGRPMAGRHLPDGPWGSCLPPQEGAGDQAGAVAKRRKPAVRHHDTLRERQIARANPAGAAPGRI